MTVINADNSIVMEIRGHERNRAWLRGWLYFVALTVLAVAVVGAGTRLTDSGLSITEWKPIHGIVPPLSEADWQEEFAKYQQIPEYLQVNKGMGLDAFKTIFWWEWAHRLLARIVVGLVFALPLAMFWMAGRIEVKLKPRLLALLALGGLQGFVGWWMVKSGLSQRVDVSQYRLAVHLTLACLIFAATLALARALAPHSTEPAQAPVRRTAGILVLALFAQIFLGALVAGLDAGMAYNTWPLMDGAVIPGDLFMIEPAWRNLFESPKTVQFVHRMTAYAIFALALLHALHASSAEAGTPHCARAWVLLALVLTQAAIGIWTLLSHIRMDTALLHQAMAFVVLGFAVAHWRGTAGPYPLPVGYDIRG